MEDHPTNIQDALQSAGMSRRSELSDERIGRARAIATGEVEFKSADARREYIMKGPGEARPTTTKGGHKVATRTNKKKEPTKAQVTKVAKLRREGATWDEVIAATGIKTNSTGFRILLEEHGFDKFGRKGGTGKSLAKGTGAGQDENLGATARGNSKSAAKKAPSGKVAGRKPTKTRRKGAKKPPAPVAAGK